MLGLCGAHRTGKSTLARAFAAKANIPFVQTQTKEIIAETGIDVREVKTFAERMTLQRCILAATEIKTYRGAPGNAVCDRTPIDMLMYLLADVRGDTLTPEQEIDLKAYAIDCYMAANRYFSAIVLVQPGIEIVDDPQSLQPSPGYMEHLNALALGLLLDDRMTSCKAFFIPKYKTNLEARVESCEGVWKKTLERMVENRQLAANAHGSVATIQ
jgi:predicted ATPase